MVAKSFVSIVIIYFGVNKVLTQIPPKVPQLFLPDPPPPPSQPAEAPLAVQALQTAIPKSESTSSCYDSLAKILQILAAREQAKKPGVQTLLPVVEQLLEMKNDDKNDIKDAIVKNSKEAMIDATANAMKAILEKNYQYQISASNMYNQGALRKIATSPNQDCQNPTPIVSTIPNNPEPIKVYYATNPANVCATPVPNINPTVNYYQNSAPPVNLTPNVCRNPAPTVSPMINVCQNAVSNDVNSVTNYLRQNYASINAVTNPSCRQGQVLGKNTWPVVPVTKVNGCLKDNDAVVVVYKPKTLTLSNTCGNVVRKTTSRMLVPHYVSKLP